MCGWGTDGARDELSRLGMASRERADEFVQRHTFADVSSSSFISSASVATIVASVAFSRCAESARAPSILILLRRPAALQSEAGSSSCGGGEGASVGAFELSSSACLMASPRLVCADTEMVDGIDGLSLGSDNEEQEEAVAQGRFDKGCVHVRDARENVYRRLVARCDSTCGAIADRAPVDNTGAGSAAGVRTGTVPPGACTRTDVALTGAACAAAVSAVHAAALVGPGAAYRMVVSSFMTPPSALTTSTSSMGSSGVSSTRCAELSPAPPLFDWSA
jgi:hypothetical protein